MGRHVHDLVLAAYTICRVFLRGAWRLDAQVSPMMRFPGNELAVLIVLALAAAGAWLLWMRA